MMRDVWLLGVTTYVTSRTIDVPEFVVTQTLNSLTVQRLPDEPIGAFALTLTNLIVGSAIQIEAAGTGEVLVNMAADSTTENIGLSVYAAGSPRNDLRIKVRKGSAAPFYQPYETQATAVVGAQSIHVSQIPDE